MDPWHLVKSHRYAEALLALNAQIASNPDDHAALANRATVLLALERFEEALADFRKADEVFSRRLPHGTDAYRNSIGAALWLLERRDEALQLFQETIDSISNGSIRYVDNAGGVLGGLLLWYTSITTASGGHAQHALKFLKGRAKNPRIEQWPGPLALYVLGSATIENVLLSEFESNNFEELTSRAMTDTLLRRRLIQALFYYGAFRRSVGDEEGCKALMSACVGLENPHVEDEWYLAFAESRMSGGGIRKASPAQATESTMQFYLKKTVEESSLISKLSNILGIAFQRIDKPEEIEGGVYQLTRYRCGFELGVSAAWRTTLKPKRDSIDAAIELSRWSGASVVTDLPQSHPLSHDPFVWCVAEPNGDLFVAGEDTSNLDREGLVLDETTRRPLSAGSEM